MPDNGIHTPSVAVVMEVPPPKEFLLEALAEAHIPVAAECRADGLESSQLAGADAVIITLDRAIEPYLDRVTELALDTDLPVIFDDSDFSRRLTGWDRNRWLRHLRAKITGSEDTRPPLPARAANQETALPAERPGRASHVWLLGASVGGPEAVRRFVEALPDNVDAAFILVQHMGPEFQPVLAERLGRVTNLDVVCAEDGLQLSAGRVVVAPVGQRLTFDEAGRILLAPHDVAGGPSPSIDRTLFELAEAFGDRAGVIIFSGKDLDGVEGSADLKRQGGAVWAQDAATATISATPDSIRDRGLADYSGSPEHLAARLVESVRTPMAMENG